MADGTESTSMNPVSEWKENLLTAAAEGDTETVSKLICENPYKENNETIYTRALHSAVRGGHTKTAEALLGADVNVDCENKDTWTPILVASAGGHTETIRMLIGHNANINYTTRYPCTLGTHALSQAAAGNHVQTLQLLLQSGAKSHVNHVDSFHRTPLVIAAEEGHFDSVKVLLNAGADVKGLSGTYALSQAAGAGYGNIVQILLESGADSDHEIPWDSSITPPLIAASAGGHSEIVQVWKTFQDI